MSVNMQRLDNGSFICRDDPGEPSTGQPRVSVAPAEMQLLSWLAAGRDVLEIGTGLGVSTRALLTARRLVTHDIDQWVHEFVWPSFADADVEFAADREAIDGRFDMVFIDGDHMPAAVTADIDFALTKLSAPGLMVLHDTRDAGVAGALSSRLQWQHVESVHGLGLAFFA